MAQVRAGSAWWQLRRRPGPSASVRSKCAIRSSRPYHYCDRFLLALVLRGSLPGLQQALHLRLVPSLAQPDNGASCRTKHIETRCRCKVSKLAQKVAYNVPGWTKARLHCVHPHWDWDADDSKIFPQLRMQSAIFHEVTSALTCQSTSAPVLVP